MALDLIAGKVVKVLVGQRRKTLASLLARQIHQSSIPAFSLSLFSEDRKLPSPTIRPCPKVDPISPEVTL